MRTPPAHINLRVRMLLTGKEWPLAWQWGGRVEVPRAQCPMRRRPHLAGDNRRARSADAERVVGIAGLDPQAAEPPTLWQMQVNGPADYLSR